jgi:hypothetical protein
MGMNPKAIMITIEDMGQAHITIITTVWSIGKDGYRKE